MISKLHHDNADCSDLNYLHEQYENYQKCCRVYKYKCQSNTQMQHCYCETVLEHRLKAEDVGYKSLVTDQYVFKAYG